MDTKTTYLGTQLAELRVNTDEADVTLNCQGEVIKTHSLILGMRSTLYSIQV